MTTTSSPEYWSPLRPRIRLFDLEDQDYADALYHYNAFTDVGVEAKPIALSFDSQTANAGTFMLEIEDSGNTLDPDAFNRGNRIFIECSKDGVTWQPAFKGLVRSMDQKLFAATGRNIVLNGYSYLVRLNERILNTVLESNVIGTDYDRTDSTMFTNALVSDLLTTDEHYMYSVDDTQLNQFFKVDNVSSSPIVEWIPRLDAQLVPLNAALANVLEFSNGLVMINPADDQLYMYTADLITPATGTFLLTNNANENADDADITMYPLEMYTYSTSYDFPDSGSRLVASIGNASVCPAQETQIPPPLVGGEGLSRIFWSFALDVSEWMGPAVQFPQTTVKNLAIAIYTIGDNDHGSSATARVYNNTSPADGYGVIGTQVGSDFTLYVNGISGTTFPNASTNLVILSMAQGATGPTVELGKWYWLVVHMNFSLSDTNYVAWRTHAPNSDDNFWGRWTRSTDGGFTYILASTFNYIPGDTDPTGTQRVYHKWKYDFTRGGTLECGGNQTAIGTHPVFSIAHDRNMSNRLGVVEKRVTSVPTYVKTAQTLREYMFNKIYYSAKPRFTFEFPSVSMPNRIPKAGDIVSHVDTRAHSGLKDAPIQTGVITQVRYAFIQRGGINDVLGLRKLALTTTGIKRGSY